MRKFAFSLETLLRHRRNLEERELARLSAIQARHQAEQATLRDLEERLAAARYDLRDKRLEGADHQEITWSLLFIDRLGRETEASRKRLGAIESELRAQTEAVVEAARNKKILDSLKDRKRREFVSLVEKQEQKDVDEGIVTRFAARIGDKQP